MDDEDSEVDYFETEFVVKHYQSKLKATSEEAFEDLKEHVSISNGGFTLDLLKKRCTPQQPSYSAISGVYQFFDSAGCHPSNIEHFLQQLLSAGKISHLLLTNKNLTSTLSPLTSPLKDRKSESTGQLNSTFNKSSTVVSGSISKATTSVSSSRAQHHHNAPSTSIITPAQKPSVDNVPLPEVSSGTRDQIVELAKQEAFVIQRIAELRKAGMWSIRRLPKVAEPIRVKAHWDYLLEEMQWLAADFVQERKWKRNSAKKCSKMIMKYHSLKGGQAQRTEKEEQIRLRRIASNIAKMVKTFWSDIEKLVEHKQEVQIKEKRKKIHDMQLRFIVDKADHFTEKLTQEFVTPSLKNSRAPSVDSDQMLVEELELPQTRKTNRINELKRKELELSKDPDEHDAEFEKGSSCSDDDEETIAKEEDQETKEPINYKIELNELESDANIPIEELLSRYGYDIEMSEQTNYTTAEDETEIDETDSEEPSNENENIDITYLVNNVNNNDSRREITEADAAAAAESIQPKGNTLSSVEVITKVPFLLKFQLREYQHIGLDWLVAMYEKNLNGILADEMGLGKTIQTISLIAHLACEKGIWGPHLIVVPTSVMLNWEMEFKKWCPSLKVLTYYGNPKERRIKRKGWTKPNTFHVCITSYKLVIQDHSSFRRKKWVYFILDEAQHIKNFKSQRWQMLLNFNSSRRLLLTGTPLQNNLMELWSLMHFLMPNVFQSHREFKDWFVNPVTGMIEGNQENDEIIRRLHKILRPFLLRRLKCDVEKQLPKKYEHIVQCSLSKRQRHLYDEYMAMGDTKDTLASGNFLSVINILMQLRKVCNHPNLFDPRPTISPFIDQEIVYSVSSLVNSVLDYQPLSQIDLSTLNLVFSHLSTELTSIDHRTIKCSQYDSVQMENLFKSEPQAKVYARVSSFEGFNIWLKKSLKSNFQTSNRSVFQIPSISVNQDVNNCDIEMELETDFFSISMIQSPAEGTLGIGKFAKKEIITRIEQLKREKLRKMILVNKRRSFLSPLYSKDCIDALNLRNETSVFISNCNGGQSSSLFSIGNGFSQCLLTQTSSLNSNEFSNALREMLYTPSSLESSLRPILERFLCIVPNVLASPIKLAITHLPSYKKIEECNFITSLSLKLPSDFFDVTAVPRIQLRFQLPELRLIQYDCGKLQTLDQLLWKLKAGNHRVLIFTQMSRMLDIFEQFLNYHGHTYLRLDGSTKIEQRQALMERFNADQRIFCFILSTRSGGVGVNLTGADTVIFYDSDWNPTMDAQAQDRCHRIGQTRDVHIYRLVSERTVEENILRKAQQKKLLGDLAIEEGNFTTAFFKQAAIQELFEIDQNNEPTDVISPPVNMQSSSADLISEMDSAASSSLRNAFEQALGTAEEETDVAAAKEVSAEAAAEFIEFDETVPIEEAAEEKSPEEEQIEQAISQLLPIEQFALQYFEKQQDFQELKQVEEEMEETKKQWQKTIKEWRQKHEEERRQTQTEAQDSTMVHSRENSSIEKVKHSKNSQNRKRNAVNNYKVNNFNNSHENTADSSTFSDHSSNCHLRPPKAKKVVTPNGHSISPNHRHNLRTRKMSNGKISTSELNNHDNNTPKGHKNRLSASQSSPLRSSSRLSSKVVESPQINSNSCRSNRHSSRLQNVDLNSSTSSNHSFSTRRSSRVLSFR